MNLFGWMNRKRRTIDPAALRQPPVGPEAEDDLAAARFAALSAYWSSVGALDPDVLAPLINPAFVGGPAWPGLRQAFRVIRRGSSVILATDGLSDRFRTATGDWDSLGMELFLETSSIPPELAGEPGSIAPLNRSWAMTLLSQAAGLVADNGGLLPTLDRLGVISTEFPGVSGAPALAGLPAGYVTDDDCLGALFGKPEPDFPTGVPDMPGGPVRMVPLVLVRADELEALRTGGAAARARIAAALAAAPSRHRSELSRPSVA